MVNCGVMIKRDGMVAMQHRTTNPKSTKTGDGTLYHFIPKFNVCMAWVKEAHVPELLAKRAKVCCGKQGQMFYLATELNVNLWESGNRHGKVDTE